MKPKTYSAFFKPMLINMGLLISGIILFTLPQPNLLILEGIPILAYIACVPVFLLVRRASWKSVWLYGILYGVGCYSFFTYWLVTFHPLGLLFIASLYGMYFLITFPLLKLAAKLFPRFGWLVQWVVFCAYEYVSTLGFAGFHYGVLGYSQWQVSPVLQSAALFGVWGVTALVIFPSAWLAEGIYASAKGTFKSFTKTFAQWVIQHRISAFAYIAVFAAVLVYGFISPVDYSQDPTMKVALIQQNTDPWKSSYRADLDTLIRLSNEALAEDPGIQMVIWPETAFVPRIDWHYRYRLNPDSFALVNELLHYIDVQKVPFLIGNDDAVLGHLDDGSMGAVDYNAVLLFKPGENVIPPTPDKYHKMHLVPFTESFPYKKMFPAIYQLLIDFDTHLWEIGTEPVVFTVDDVSFSTPICFEDNFGNLVRGFINKGAQVIINLSNDAWAKSLSSQYQHLSMGLFRSVENRVPTVRATASGQTALIDPNGKILAMAKPFVPTYLIVDIPIPNMDRKTLYTVCGDFLGIFFVASALILLAVGIILKIHRKPTVF